MAPSSTRHGGCSKQALNRRCIYQPSPRVCMGIRADGIKASSDVGRVPVLNDPLATFTLEGNLIPDIGRVPFAMTRLPRSP